MSQKVLVGLSGGVDSAVSAYLLQEQGYEVSGGFMINYLTEDDSCPTRIDMEAAREVARYLDIPFFTFDFREEYEKRVLKYLFEGYAKGLTPNPDVFCNTWIKFDLFLEEALSSGFDFVATGHYARVSEQEQRAKSKEQREEFNEMNNVEGIMYNGGNGNKLPLKNSVRILEGVGGDAGEGDINSKLETHSSFVVNNNENHLLRRTENLKLLRGTDHEKDQSYFLSALSGEQLEHVLFPIGHLLKSEVREIARKAGLPNAERKDSQGLCFVGKVDFAEFLSTHIPLKHGDILDIHGNIIGTHEGAFRYTIGQRKGIAVGGGPALYVLEKNVTNNTITVGEKTSDELFKSSCKVSDVHWFCESVPVTCEAQIRYRQKAQPCTLVSRGEFIEVQFSEEQRAITPGQVCAFYEGDEVLGSGVII